MRNTAVLLRFNSNATIVFSFGYNPLCLCWLSYIYGNSSVNLIAVVFFVFTNKPYTFLSYEELAGLWNLDSSTFLSRNNHSVCSLCHYCCLFLFYGAFWSFLFLALACTMFISFFFFPHTPSFSLFSLFPLFVSFSIWLLPLSSMSFPFFPLSSLLLFPFQ